MSDFYIPVVKGVKQVPSFSGITELGDYVLYHLFYGNTSLTSVSFPDLVTISGERALSNTFETCTSLTSVSLPNLTTISGEESLYYTFSGCTSLTSVSFPSLTTVSGDEAFYWCFWRCSALTSIYFPKLTTVTYARGLFRIIYAINGCTIHFKTGTESTISTLTGYPNFGGTNTTLVFDL